MAEEEKSQKFGKISGINQQKADAEKALSDKQSTVNKDLQEKFERARAGLPAEEPAIKHVWTKEDTYGSLAMKYYGSMKEPYWRLIYDHNKAIIGNHPNDIRVGLEIEIPPLPDELKQK
jgi:nucleoid-associated protein YgaU